MVRQSDNLGYWSLFTCRSRKAGLIRHPNLSHGQTTSASFHLNLSVNRSLPSRPKGEIQGSKTGIRNTRFLASLEMTTFKIRWNDPQVKLRLEPTKHDPASVKQSRCFVKQDSFAKPRGKSTNYIPLLPLPSTI